MGSPAEPKRAKYFIAFLLADLTPLAELESELALVPNVREDNKYFG